MSLSKQISRTEISEFKFKNPQLSVENAVEYMKKLTVVAVSNVLYLRDVFPSTAFADRRLGDMRIKVLRGVEDIPGSRTMIDWIRSAFTALESHFLKKLVIVIEKGDEIPIETYTFVFEYKRDMILCNTVDTNDKIQQSNEVPRDIKSAAQQMLRSIFTVTQMMDILPDEAEIGMRLEFNDFVPEDYQLPEHFMAIDSLGITFSETPIKFKMGKVETKFSTISMTTRYIKKEQGEGEDESDADADDIVISSQPEPRPSLTFSKTPQLTTQPGDHTTLNAERNIDKPSTEQEAKTLSETLSSVRLRDVVQCICGCVDMVSNNLLCDVCGNHQHRACYKLVGDQPVMKHVCVDCHVADNPNRTCTDTSLLSDQNRKEGAQYRRALALCLTVPKLSMNTLMSHLNTSRQVAQQIYNRLDIDGCLQSPAGRGKIRAVKTEYIKENLLSLYFNTPENDIDMAEMDTEENVLHLGAGASGKIRKRLHDLDGDKENINPDIQGKRMKFSANKKPFKKV